MITTLKNTDILTDWKARSSWLDVDQTTLLRIADAASSVNGIDISDVLTVNTLGLSLRDRLWIVVREPVMGRDLFSFLTDCLNRFPDTLHEDSAAVVPFLNQGAAGSLISREDLAEVRLNSKSMFPKGFDPTTDIVGNEVSFAAYLSILALEEILRDRAWRSVRYAQTAIGVLAERPGTVSVDDERQWMIDQVATYL